GAAQRRASRDFGAVRASRLCGRGVADRRPGDWCRHARLPLRAGHLGPERGRRRDASWRLARSVGCARERAGRRRDPAGESVMTTTTVQTTDLDALAITTMRTLAIDAVQKARSGHPGTPMGAAPVAYTLWQRVLRFDPKAPAWPDRDRFVLSSGH